MSSSRNIVLHRKSGFHPTGKPMGFTPQIITELVNRYKSFLRLICLSTMWIPSVTHSLGLKLFSGYLMIEYLLFSFSVESLSSLDGNLSFLVIKWIVIIRISSHNLIKYDFLDI